MPIQAYQFLFSANPKLTFLEGSFGIGANGAIAPSTGITGSTGFLGSGTYAVTKTGTGQYEIQLNANYFRLLDFQVMPVSPTTGGGFVTDGSLTVGKPYQIVFPSTSTNWTVLGIPTGVTPAYGVPFVATSGASNGASSAGVAGNGTVVPIITTGIQSVEVLPNPNTTLNPLGLNNANSGPTKGGYIQFQTLGINGTSATIPSNPTSGTVIRWNASLRNSSLYLNGEGPNNY